MTAKLDTVNVQLPRETVAAIQRIAKLAGVKPETIMKIAIAMECEAVTAWNARVPQNTTHEVPPNRI